MTDHSKYYDKFDGATKLMCIYAKAASVNAGCSVIHPESYLVGMLVTGENNIVIALNARSVDLEKIHSFAKNKLKSKANKDSSSLDNMRPSPQVWAAIEEADKIATKAKSELITLEFLFAGLCNKCKDIKDYFTDLKIDLKQFLEELINGKYKKPTPQQNAKSDLIESMCINITEKAASGKLDPIISRDEEIEEAITILCKRMKPNPVLLGEAGVGKTSIVEGIAQRIASKSVPEKLLKCRIYALPMTSLVENTKYRGEFEAKLKNLLKELESDPNIIIFIDEIHTMIGAGGSEGSGMDVSNILKPALANGSMRCIGATTYNEYKKYIEKDEALSRRFQKVTVNEPNKEQCFRIMHGIKHKYEDFHNCKINSDVIKSAIDLSDRYLTTLNFPDKMIDCIDTACAKQAWNIKTKPYVLKSEDIANVISKKANISIDIIRMGNLERMKYAEDFLTKNIVGQQNAINCIIRTMQKVHAGIRDPKMPIALFVIGGPTGVGKTHTAKMVAEAYFGSENALIRIDCAEYSEAISKSRIIGAAPGYVGYNDETELEKIRRNPYSVILLDEFDKAHIDVIRLFLSVAREGTMKDSIGNEINFRNCIIMFAGNFGMNTYKVNNSIGFDNSSKNEDINQKEYNNQKERLIDYCKEYFGAEFANRVSEFIPYATLTDENLKMIATLHLESLKKRLEGLYTIQFDDNIYDYILSKKTNEHGANASIIDRIIKRDIEEIITSKVIEYKKTENEKLLVKISYDGVKLIGEASSVKISCENKNEEAKEDSKEENNENKKQRTKIKQNNEK